MCINVIIYRNIFSFTMLCYVVQKKTYAFKNVYSKVFFIFRFVNSIAYYGLSWSTSSLGGNQFLVFNLAGLVEFPAYIFLLMTLNRWGRKINISGFLILAGLSLLATLAIPKSNLFVH